MTFIMGLINSNNLFQAVIVIATSISVANLMAAIKKHKAAEVLLDQAGQHLKDAEAHNLKSMAANQEAQDHLNNVKNNILPEAEAFLKEVKGQPLQ